MQSLTTALPDVLASGKPARINCAIDPTVGTESGHLQKLNPQGRIGNTN
jgi:oxalyl-CoA decarboxylase